MNLCDFSKDDIDRIVISHTVWRNLFRRCYNPRSSDYVNYGGRGIKVCDRWHGEDGFYNFIKDIGLRPSKDYSLDRIDVNKGYSPDNVRWADAKTQAQNKRNNIVVSFMGSDANLANLARRYKVSYQSLWKMTQAHGIKPEEALEKLLQPKKQSISDIARANGIKPSTLMRRLRSGVPMDVAISAPLRSGVKTYEAAHGC
jgi:hypothetical protein